MKHFANGLAKRWVRVSRGDWAVAKNTWLTVGARYIITALAAGSAAIIATQLGAKGAGTYAQVRVLPTVIAALLGGGLTIATPYFIGTKKYATQAIVETSMALGMVLSVIGLLAWWFGGPVLHAHVYTQLSREAALCVGLAIPLQIFCNYLNSIQQGLLDFKGANLVLIVEEFVAFALLTPLLFGLSVGPTTIVVSAVVSTGAAAALAAALLLRRGLRPFPRFHRTVAVDSIRFGLRGHIGRISNMLTWRLDVMLLSFLAPVEVVGNYAVASKVAELFRPVSASLTFVLRPMIAALPVEQARQKGIDLYRRYFLGNLVAVTLMAFAGGPLILRLFGPEFAPAVPAFQILLFGLAALGASGVLNGFNVGIGKPEFNSYTALAGMIVTVVGDFALIPTYHLMGAAVVSSAAYTVKAIALTTLFMSHSGVSFAQLVGLKESRPDAA